VINRTEYRRELEESLAQFRVTALLGPRQCGKTTLAGSILTGSAAYFDLEDPVDLARLETPRMALERLQGLHLHPKLGASWEGFVVEQVLRTVRAAPGEAFDWGTHAGAELDLLLPRGKRCWGFEVKYADAPRTTKSMRAALDSLRLDRLLVIDPGTREYELDDRITVLPLTGIGKLSEWTGAPA
jgi:predicted AAA+ superfamily ATPase